MQKAHEAPQEKDDMTRKPVPRSGPGKSAPATAPRVPAPVAEPETTAPPEETRAEVLKLKELVERVVQATGAKKKDTRELVEATLGEISAALLRGEELNLPGLGRVRVARSAEKEGRATVTLKMRTASGGKKKEAKEALAEAEEAV
jgi:nucleoid DNA-binding protein